MGREERNYSVPANRLKLNCVVKTMKVQIYQIHVDRDKNRVRHVKLDDLAKYQGSSKVNEALYDRVFKAEVDCEDLEQLYTLINCNGHPLYHGGEMKVSDVVVTEEGAFYCDRFGFSEIEFDEAKAVIPEGLMRVLYVEPGKAPYETEIPDMLEFEQQAVQGPIELVHLDRRTLLLCNEEAKYERKPGNRRLDNGSIIAGPFLIVGDGGSEFCSLTDAQAERYMQKFKDPHEISQDEVQADMGMHFIPL